MTHYNTLTLRHLMYLSNIRSRQVNVHPEVLTSSCDKHGATINSLAEQGKINPCYFRLDGKGYVANSIWTATEFLKAQGFYQDPNGMNRMKWVELNYRKVF